MTRPDGGNLNSDRGGGKYTPPIQALVSEADDRAHYYFAPYREFMLRGDRTFEPVFFGAGGYDSTALDLRDNDTLEGVAFVRTIHGPDRLALQADPNVIPPEVFYVGQSLLAPLPPAKRTEARQRLKLRGQITDVKSILRFMLLTEAGENGKPGRLAPDPEGGLYVYIGDLRVDLS